MRKLRYLVLAVLVVLMAVGAVAHGEEPDHRTAHHTEASFWETDILPLTTAGLIIATLTWIYRIRSESGRGEEDDKSESTVD